MEVAKGIHRLSLGVSNWYLVEEGGRAILVDAGAPGDWSLLLSTLADRGLPMSALEAVLLTHAHSDHTGFAERARAEGGANVWIHQADAAIARGAKPPKNDGGVLPHLFHLETWRSAISLMRRGGIKIIPIAEVLRSLAVLEGVRADVVLPGHGDPFTGGPAEAVRLARAAGTS